MTPEGLAGLLRRDVRPGSLLGDGVALAAPGRLSDAWALFARSGFDGLTSFLLVPPPGPGGEYRLRFGLSGWRWRLRAIELPQPVLVRLVDEFRARRERGN